MRQLAAKPSISQHGHGSAIGLFALAHGFATGHWLEIAENDVSALHMRSHGSESCRRVSRPARFTTVFESIADRI